MEAASDGNLLARILLTIATVGYAFGPMRADFNRTHATNPLWTAHARFHVVWQVLGFSAVGVVALFLIWMDGPMPRERLVIAAALGFAVLGTFFLVALLRPLFGGALHDENGYRPYHPFFAPAHWRWDINATVFSVWSLFLLAGFLAIG